MRGTWDCLRQILNYAGIIPACAGNIPSCFVREGVFWDHPRVCGEHVPLNPRKGYKMGSSPRVRGTCTAGFCEEVGIGIIPACAGNILLEYSCLAPCRDHPRVCGEHVQTSTLSAGTEGSSPRVRGTSASISFMISSCRIIPACAGNINDLYDFFAVIGDHPRVCGEHFSGNYQGLG